MATDAASSLRNASLPRALLVGFVALLGAVTPAAMATAATTTSRPGVSPPLVAPKTTPAQDSAYLTDVAVADPALSSYGQKYGNVALRALLTDGTAFCALLQRTRHLDDALVEEASGARGTDARTHLPLSVTTFNTIEATALLALCPGEQKLLPSSVRTRIHRLGAALSKRHG